MVLNRRTKLNVIRKMLSFFVRQLNYLLIETRFGKNAKKQNSNTSICETVNSDKDNNKNIMILVSRLSNGGAERVAKNVAEELNKKYNVILTTIYDKTDEDYECNVKRIILGSNARILKDYSLVKQLRKIKQENNITHTISFCSRVNYLNVMSRENDISIISIRNYLSKSEKEKKYKHINKKTAKIADKVVVVSKILEQEQIEEFGANKEKIYVINNFCDTEKIERSIEKDIIKDENTVINIGRLTYQKGQIHLIRAFKKVVEEIPNAKLIILGKGELKQELEKEIERCNLQGNVFLKGFQKNPYIYLKKSNLFVLSSFYEGMSNVILEAMACGLPIISTDCRAGTREIIAPSTELNEKNTEYTKEEYGILVPVIKNEKDENCLTQAIIEVLRNNKLGDYYAQKSKERIKDFSKEKIMRKWFELI